MIAGLASLYITKCQKDNDNSKSIGFYSTNYSSEEIRDGKVTLKTFDGDLFKKEEFNLCGPVNIEKCQKMCIQRNKAVKRCLEDDSNLLQNVHAETKDLPLEIQKR